MRPEVAAEQPSARSRKSSLSDGSTPVPSRQKTFFLTRDPDQIHSSSRSKSPQASDTLETRLERELSNSVAKQHGTHFAHVAHDGNSGSRRRSTLKPNVSSPHDHGMATGNVSRLQIVSHTVPFTSSRTSPISTSSQRSEIQMTAEVTGPAVVSSDEDDIDDKDTEANIGDSAPQLIMPSIRMPSRRPFTERGKQLGRLKILVTGSQGSGRTSLIKSIVQLCEHIVHIDTMTNAGKSADPSNDNKYGVSEIYASTKPYPEWWSDVDESRILKRRKSLGNSILERNICFADTTESGKIDNTLAYIEQQFFDSISSVNRPGNELRNLLSGRGGCQVDLVLYLVTKDTLKVDLDRMRKISRLTNVVPLVAKTDLLSDEHVTNLKSALASAEYSLPKLPVFGRDGDESLLHAPYRVSSANGPDFDNMDASLLMSPEYVQPLLSSDLALLVDQIFEPQVLEYLRHSSGKKLVAWYASNPRLTKPVSPSLGSAPLSNPESPAPASLSHSGFLNPATSEVSLNTSNSFALAKVADHTQREEHLAQLRLCKWASELQLSLQRERERYENVAQGERALWLVQKMGEEIRDGQIVPVQPYGTLAHTMSDGKRLVMQHGASGRYEVYDPLGLIRWQDVVRARGWVMLQIIGSFGVVGGVTIWLAKTFGWTHTFHQWIQTLNGKWYGNE